jgi:hypothetical protein
VCYYHAFHAATLVLMRIYHIMPMPVRILAEGEEVSSLYPANEPSSRNGVSGSSNSRTLSRAELAFPIRPTKEKAPRLVSLLVMPCAL